MKIIIPGGTGQVGNLLARAFHADGHEVIVLSRKKADTPWRVLEWDGRTYGSWAMEINGSDVVINLAGRSVNCRYNSENRKAILESRVQSARVIGEAIGKAAKPPQVWLQMSTATIYAHRYDAPNDEINGIIGGPEKNCPDKWRFSIDVAAAWEHACDETVTPETRKVLMRTAMVLSPDRGGIFDVLLNLVRHGLGGASGSGRQYMSWIHGRDLIRAVYWLIDHADLTGPVNLASPGPLPNRDFMHYLRKAWGIPLGLAATQWMIEVGTLLLRTESELILKSRRVVPRKLLDSGFEFEFPSWPEASLDLCRTWRAIGR